MHYLTAFTLTLLFAGTAVPGPASVDQDEVRPDEPVHDHVYSLPFRGKARRVSQASNGATHKGGSRHAIDFPMPRGTPIYAARGGTVVTAIGHHPEVSKQEKRLLEKKPPPNRIAVRHEDESVAVYLHLRQDGVAVERGNKVEAGDLIGYSGNTGKSSGPHLHFCVFERTNGKKGSVRVQFETQGSGVTVLEKGRRYKSPAAADALPRGDGAERKPDRESYSHSRRRLVVAPSDSLRYI